MKEGRKDGIQRAAGSQYPETLFHNGFQDFDVLEYIIGRNDVEAVVTERKPFPDSGHETGHRRTLTRECAALLGHILPDLQAHREFSAQFLKTNRASSISRT